VVVGLTGDMDADAARTLPGYCPDVVADSGGILPGHGSGHPPDTKTLSGQGVGLAVPKLPSVTAQDRGEGKYCITRTRLDPFKTAVSDE